VLLRGKIKNGSTLWWTSALVGQEVFSKIWLFEATGGLLKKRKRQ